jgi:hypothetical protein
MLSPTPQGLAIFAFFCALLALLVSSPASAQDMTSTLVISGSKIDVTIESGELKLAHAELLRWVQNAAEAVATYYGRYPVPHVDLQIIPVGGSGVRHGQTYQGCLIKIRVGSETTAGELVNDWMLTHEMVHLSFPSMPDQHHWIEEGIAVYVEPIARIQAKQMEAPQMWADLMRDMPKGLPQEGDRGLDHTHTWGRTYWGGALFCFLADVEIRRQTHNQKGLQDALRAILNSGGDIREDRNLEDTLKIGDRSTGTAVLIDLYAKMRDQPVETDLSSMWKQLGVAAEGKSVHFDEKAPLAAIRRAITHNQSASAGTIPSMKTRSSAVLAGRTRN